MGTEVQVQTKNLKWRMIIADAAVILFGLLMMIFPGDSKNIICRAAGIILCVIGAVRAVSYFVEEKTDAVLSLSLAEGAALIGFGVYFLIKPENLAAFLSVALAIVLFIGGVIKLQYAIDFLRMKASWWWIELLGAALMILFGVMIFVNPFEASNGLMIFIGIAFLIDGVWDLVSVIFLSATLKKVRQGVEQAVRNSNAVEVEAKDVPDGPAKS